MNPSANKLILLGLILAALFNPSSQYCKVNTVQDNITFALSEGESFNIELE
jgi:hypothetical protein